MSNQFKSRVNAKKLEIHQVKYLYKFEIDMKIKFN